MLAWFNSLDPPGMVFASFAIPGTVILILQTIMLLFGFGHEDGEADAGVHMDDAHVDGHGADSGDGLALFSVRGIVAFFSVGGWTGLALNASGMPVALTVLLAFLAGLLAMVAVAWIMKSALRLQSSGNLDMNNTVGLTGRVYIRIPAGGRDTGKVSLTVQERYSELEAVTDASRDLAAGEAVRVTGVQQGGVLVVSPLAEVRPGQAVPDHQNK